MDKVVRDSPSSFSMFGVVNKIDGCGDDLVIFFVYSELVFSDFVNLKSNRKTLNIFNFSLF